MSNAVAPLSPLEELAMHVAGAMPGAVESHVIAFDELTLLARADQIVPLMIFLRDDPRCQFQTLVDLCGADYPERPQRFDVVYHLLSMRRNKRVRVKIRTDEIASVIKREIEQFSQQLEVSEVGRVVEVGDGIARIYGLSKAMAGELLEFQTAAGNVMGQVFNLELDTVGAVIYGDYLAVKEGDQVTLGALIAALREA